MEPKQSDGNLVYVYPPAPTMVRGHSTFFTYCAAKDKIAYCSGRVVVIRSVTDFYQCDLYYDHLNETTTARFAPNGNYICSGDNQGHIRIWDVDGEAHILKKSFDFINGPVKDIAWTSDSQRICMVGEGKEAFGKIFVWDTGSTVGEIMGHSKVCLTTDFKPTRPFRLLIGSEDSSLSYYEGPPFKFNKTIKEHTTFINCLRYNNSGDFAVSVGSDKKVVLLNGQNAEVIKDLNAENLHTAGIYCVSWLEDSKRFVTASADKTLRVWDAVEQNCALTLNIRENPTNDDFQMGVVATKSHIISASFSGALNLWPIQGLENNATPVKTFAGHSSTVTALININQHNALLSGDANGVLVIWRGKDGSFVEKSPLIGGSILTLSATTDQSLVYVINAKGTLALVSGATGTIVKDNRGASFGSPIGLVASKAKNDVCYVAYETSKKVVVFVDLVSSREIPLEFVPTAIESTNNDTELLLGDKDGNVHVIDIETGAEKTSFKRYGYKVSSIAISKGTDSLVAVGDNVKRITLWDYETKTVVTEDWVFHNAAITSLLFSNNNKYVISAGLDNKLIVWNVEKRARDAEILSAHKLVTHAAVFAADGQIISGGGDNSLKVFKLTGTFDF
eukprot:TRINITY_DN1508_c0_g1_i5.p1 TRINITY_DN1508_c0_g1~~TRINITY_DN1508_c0_g1_i5.p1  ORF type:complete len:620 (-),score=158.44 TRINITY_DN1508_c0_g1_i5:65-1924(-)